jgi:uncharacterized cupin superfamily protein
MPNIFEPDWDAEQDQPPFRWRRSRIGRQAGAHKLGASVYELSPGCSSWPLHIHHANEEMIVVLSGHPTLRTLETNRQLHPGDAIACPSGRDGAHRVDNPTDESVRVLVVSTMIAPELSEYPESGKLWGVSFAPGGTRDPSDVQLLARPKDNLDYFDGEA